MNRLHLLGRIVKELPQILTLARSDLPEWLPLSGPGSWARLGTRGHCYALHQEGTNEVITRADIAAAQVSCCTCHADILAKAESQLRASMGSAHPGLKVRWRGQTYSFNKATGRPADTAPAPEVVAYESHKIKRDGSRSARATKGSLLIRPTFCCHCGRRYQS